MRKILLGLIILSVLGVSACEKKEPVPSAEADVEAFLRGENPELMELFDEQN